MSRSTLSYLFGLALSTVLIAVGASTGACDRERPASGEQASGSALAEGWTALDEGALDEAQQAQAELATVARQTLASRLFETLSSTIQASGHVEAISVCQDAAPEIARSLAEEMDLNIGRTSFRLRNPGNLAPGWAEPLVEERVEAPRYAAGPDGQLGVLAPIHAAPPCLACHGEPGNLAPGIADALAQRYPSDRATGFAEGDLRGYFWVEVPGR